MTEGTIWDLQERETEIIRVGRVGKMNMFDLEFVNGYIKTNLRIVWKKNMAKLE